MNGYVCVHRCHVSDWGSNWHSACGNHSHSPVTKRNGYWNHASTVARRTFELQISGGNEMVYHWLDQKPETIIPRCCPVELTEHVEKCKNICTSHLGHSVWSADTPPVCVYMERAPMFQEKGKGSHWSMFSEIRNNKQLSFENLGSCGHISEGS